MGTSSEMTALAQPNHSPVPAGELARVQSLTWVKEAAPANAFYRIVDAAYERRSIAVTSNIHPSGFDTIMPKTLATVDRLLHHAHLITTEGDSHRLQQALTGKRVKALT